MVVGFVENGGFTTLMCLVCPALGFLFSYLYVKATSRVEIDPAKLRDQSSDALVVNEELNQQQMEKIWKVYGLIYDGAHSFLYAEYKFVMVFVVIFSILILIVLGLNPAENRDGATGWADAAFTMLAFIIGCGTSILAGFVGMKIGVYANARTAVQCQRSLAEGFTTSFKAGIVMGFCLCSFGVLNLFVTIMIFRLYYTKAYDDEYDTEAMFEAIAGYGLGGSSIALFGRVGGGIYTKAADVGADLVGKVEQDIPEDDPRNPAVIADNVGDNVGDIAGMGADLFGSFAEASCAALVIASQSSTIPSSQVWQHWGYVSFPLIISCVGLLACFLTSFVATHLAPANEISQIEPTLKRQLLISTVLMTIGLALISMFCLPEDPWFEYPTATKNWHVFICAACGLWSGLIIGYITEYYTSNRYKPVQEVSESCQTGAATNIIYGLALGYKSVIIPASCLAFTAFLSHSLAGFYGVAMAALGILSTLSIGLTIDAFGPICDNAGGIAEMCEMGEHTRDRTDALDAAGNTTAAIGKGFAIGSAAFVSLALFSGFVTVVQNKSGNLKTVDILEAKPFAGLLMGAMLPYWFSAMTMKSVGKAAYEMVKEVREQFRSDPGILTGESEPNYDRCIVISTKASLIEMLFPGLLVMGSPLVAGFVCGVEVLAGLLAGALVSGVQMAISSSNTGGAWDNAKKYIEGGEMGGKGSEPHKAAVIGDTVGDPLKDTSGPSLNILIKLMAIISLVFARSFPKNAGGWIGEIYDKLD